MLEMKEIYSWIICIIKLIYTNVNQLRECTVGSCHDESLNAQHLEEKLIVKMEHKPSAQTIIVGILLTRVCQYPIQRGRAWQPVVAVIHVWVEFFIYGDPFQIPRCPSARVVVANFHLVLLPQTRTGNGELLCSEFVWENSQHLTEGAICLCSHNRAIVRNMTTS